MLILKSGKTLGIIIFTKVPQPGFVKTRLVHKDLNSQFNSKLQEAMLKDTLLNIHSFVNETVVILAFYPREKRKILQERIIKPLNQIYPEFINRIKIIPQEGEDIGSRFAFSFNYAFKCLKLRSAIIIGSDTPHLQPNIISSALKILQENFKNSVIGPSQNGGFYLLGINESNSLSLDKIFTYYTTYNELGNAIDLLIRETEVYILPEVTDIDCFENLKSVRELIHLYSIASSVRKNYYFPSYTYEVINSLPLKIWREGME